MLALSARWRRPRRENAAWRNLFRRGLLVALPTLLVVGLAGCPKRSSPETGLPDAEPGWGRAPTLVRSFTQLSPSLYASLRESGNEPAVLSELERLHDAERYTRTRSLWGTLRVVEFRDTDHPVSGEQACAGWFLGVRSSEGLETVEAALLRDFTDAPEGPAVEGILRDLAEQWPPPWSICRPTGPTAVDEAVAYDSERGLKLGFVREGPEPAAPWTVDHVEYFHAGLVLEQWWLAKGYTGCEALGTLDEEGRYRPAGRSQ